MELMIIMAKKPKTATSETDRGGYIGNSEASDPSVTVTST
jgi:hypothetical protein